MDSSWILLGPTACGKTDLSLDLAERHDLEIVSMDSMQVYRDLPLLTQVVAHPERRGIPHHLLEILEAGESFDTGRYLERVSEVLAGIRERGRRALFVGGTALYYRALVDGLSPLPPADPERRLALESVADREGVEALWKRLEAIDPGRAAKVHPRDRKRLIRALEIAELTGEAPSALYQRPRPVVLARWRAVGLTRDRAELEARISARIEAQWAAGLVAEVESFRARHGDRARTSLQALGLPLVLELLEGKREESAARAAMIKGTRLFARRQMTSFRADPRIEWVEMTQRDRAEVLDRVSTIFTKT